VIVCMRVCVCVCGGVYRDELHRPPWEAWDPNQVRGASSAGKWVGEASGKAEIRQVHRQTPSTVGYDG
jgi:hypothetical protein